MNLTKPPSPARDAQTLAVTAARTGQPNPTWLPIFDELPADEWERTIGSLAGGPDALLADGALRGPARQA